MKRMRQTGSRTITVKKSKLIRQIQANKENHIYEYKKAVEAYKVEALRQLNELIKKVEQGDLRIQLNLITPIDNTENYEKIIEMFEWEIENTVVLEQDEFNEYVLDETEFAVQAKFSNTMYSVR
jgi:hypothetical protein